MSKVSFCGGTLCKERDRKFICKDCGVAVCSICSVKYKDMDFCINCYVENYLVCDITEEFNLMLQDLKIPFITKKENGLINEK